MDYPGVPYIQSITSVLIRGRLGIVTIEVEIGVMQP